MIKIYINLGPSCDFGPRSTALYQHYLNAVSTDMKMVVLDEYKKQLNEWIDTDCVERLLGLWSLVEQGLTNLGVTIDWADNVETDFLLDHGFNENYVDPFDPDIELVSNLPFNFTGIIKLTNEVPEHAINYIRLSTDHIVEEINE